MGVGKTERVFLRVVENRGGKDLERSFLKRGWVVRIYNGDFFHVKVPSLRYFEAIITYWEEEINGVLSFAENLA